MGLARSMVMKLVMSHETALVVNLVTCLLMTNPMSVIRSLGHRLIILFKAAQVYTPRRPSVKPKTDQVAAKATTLTRF